MTGEKINRLMPRKPYFGAAVFILFIFFWLDGGAWVSEGYIFEMFAEINMLGSSTFIIPIACALPAVLDYFEEKQTLNYRYKIMRSGRLSYAFRTISRGMLSGGMVMFTALALLLAGFFVMSAIKGWDICWVSTQYGDEIDRTIYFELFERGMGWLVLLLNVLMMVCNGMLWPCFGIILSTFVTNRKLAIIFPFLLFRLFAYIYNFNSYLTPLGFNLTLGVVYEPLGGFLRVAIYLVVVFAVGVVTLMLNMSYMYRKGD